MKEFNLFWRNIEIGSLIETGWDMRSSGEIQFKFNYNQGATEHTRLSNYIKHSIEAGNCLENGDEEKYRKMCKEELQFIDLINSSDWRLINEKGEITQILCPIFHDNNEITWQLDFENN